MHHLFGDGVVGHHSGHHDRLVSRVHETLDEVGRRVERRRRLQPRDRLFERVRRLVGEADVLLGGNDAQLDRNEEAQGAVRPRHCEEQVLVLRLRTTDVDKMRNKLHDKLRVHCDFAQ